MAWDGALFEAECDPGGSGGVEAGGGGGGSRDWVLNLLSQELESQIADQRGDDGDGEVRWGDDVAEGGDQSSAALVGGFEVAHQEV